MNYPAHLTDDQEREQGVQQHETAPVMLSLIGAAHAVEDRIEGALSEFGLSMAKLNFLTKLVDADQPLTLGEIAARLACVRSNVTQLIDRLEADGLVRRIDDANDRRSIRAEITYEGRARQAAGARALSEIQTDFLKVLGGSVEQTAMAQLLARLL